MDISSRALADLLGDWRAGPGPAHRKLSDRLRILVLDGRLPLGTGMPGERDLSASLGVSRTTVGAAYGAVRDQGYLTSQSRTRSRTSVPTVADVSRQALPSGGRRMIDLSFASPPAPAEALHRAYAFALSQLPRHLDHHGYTAQGVPALREVLAQDYCDRGVPTTPDQIMVTNGAQHALNIIVRTLLPARSRVVVDHPTYPHALTLFISAKCRVLPVALAGADWDLDRLAEASRDASLAYLVTDFHNPTGSCMSEQGRQRLDMSCPIVVDETMSELGLDCPRPTPLSAYQPNTISVGSASKSFWGGLRVGWIRADRSLVQRFAQARTSNDLGTPVVEQLAVLDLLLNAGAILQARKEMLRDQRAHLAALIETTFPEWEAPLPLGGLSFWVRQPQARSTALAAIAPEFGVRLAPGTRFGIGGAFDRFLRLPFSLDAASLTEGLEGVRLADAAVTSGRWAEHQPSDLA